jgi:hypothetical protein
MNDNKQVGGNGVTIEEPCEGPTNNNIVVERFDEERQYRTRKRQPLGE